MRRETDRSRARLEVGPFPVHVPTSIAAGFDLLVTWPLAAACVGEA
jgi:hypothetical protein